MKHLLNFFKDKKNLNLQLLGLFFILTSSLANLFLPKFLAKIMDFYLQNRLFEIKQIIIVIVISTFAVLSVFLSNFILSFLSDKLAYYLRSELMTKIIRQPDRYFIKNQPSKILTVLSSDINFIKNVFGRLVSVIASSIILLIGSLVLMLSINSRLALYILVLIVIIVSFVMFLFSKVKKLFKKNRKLQDIFNKIIDENVKASMLIRVFVAQKFEIKKFSIVNKDTLNIGLKTNRILALIMPSIHFINLFSSLLIVVLGGKQIINQTMSLGEMTVFSNYVMMFTFSIVMFGVMGGQIGQATVSLQRISSVLLAKNDFKNGFKKLKKIDSIEFKNVSLVIDKKDILKNINLVIKKGQKIGLIGPTGSGKSILLQLITRVLDPTSGQILINHQDINLFDIKTIRNQIGVAFQEALLFDGSLHKNIDFGRNLSDKDILWASQVSLSSKFINKFKSKFDYQVGEFGRKLSGGQKQRVTIARAIVTRPKLIILDDVTSNLDITTEKQIIKNIQQHLKDTTLLIVSQKIASIKDCHQIYVLENGQITASGTHDQLKKTSLLYQEINISQKNYSSS